MESLRTLFDHPDDGNDGNYIQFTEIDASLFAKAKKALLKGVGARVVWYTSIAMIIVSVTFSMLCILAKRNFFQIFLNMEQNFLILVN